MKVLASIGSTLNSTIRSLLYGGGSDAGFEALEGAAACFGVLKALRLQVRDEAGIRKTLSSENVYEENFLSEEADISDE